MVRKEDQEIDEVKDGGACVVAFFDLDGTLMPLPSLEKRFFLLLRRRNLIGIRRQLFWLLEALRLAPRGINQIMKANKMYLRGVPREEALSWTDTFFCRRAQDSRPPEEVIREESSRQARMPVPSFFPAAMERAAWHAEHGHLIVIVSGTLEPLATLAARALQDELAARGMACKIRVCATRLEEEKGRWTGRIVGEAMFGEAKARAVRRIAAEADLDLERCCAYGDGSSDRWMLETVGKPIAVNPSNDLGRIARRNCWTVLRWGGEEGLTQRTRRTKRSQRKEETGRRLQAERAKSGYGS